MIRPLDHGLRAQRPGEGDPHGIIVVRYLTPRWSQRSPGVALDSRTIGNFRRHLELLDRWGFTTITLSDYRLFLEGHLHLPRRPMMITFDGLAGLLSLAPLLAEMGSRAIVFVAVEMMRGPERAIDGTSLRSMAAAGIEIGSFMSTSRRLTDLSPAERDEELAGSREFLEDLLGAPVDSCAYPFDAVDPEVKRAVRAAGYTFAMAGPGGARLFGSDPLEIRRRELSPESGTLALAFRSFAPADRMVRFKTRSLALISRDPTTFEPEPFA